MSDPQLEEPAGREQRQVRGVREQRIPVEAALEEMHLAVGVALGPRGSAERIAGLGDQQRLGAGDEVGAAQAAGQCSGQRLGGDSHCARKSRPEGLEGRDGTMARLGMRGRLCRLDPDGSTR